MARAEHIVTPSHHQNDHDPLVWSIVGPSHDGPKHSVGDEPKHSVDDEKAACRGEFFIFV